MSNIADDHVKLVCQPGKQCCCSFLTMHGSSGWTCVKAAGLEGLKALIDKRRAEKSIRAMGDNCSGPPGFKVSA